MLQESVRDAADKEEDGANAADVDGQRRSGCSIP